MNKLNIKTILGICHRNPPQHGILFITRGATADLAFNLLDKIYSFESINQLTFSFKQGDLIYWYCIFNYLVKSSDTSVVAGKDYYTVTQIIDPVTLQCEAEKVESPTGSPVLKEYFELACDSGIMGVNCWVLDEHFTHKVEIDEATSTVVVDEVVLTLSSEETSALKLTTPRTNMQFEVAARFTDSDTDKQIVLIEPQHPIAVIDSLYNQIQ